MIVVTLTDCPPKLRGDLSKWLLEVNTGVYVGKASARVRDALWNRVCENISTGRATMVFSTNNEQGLDFRVHNTSWEPTDFEGIKLMMRPATVSLEDSSPTKKSNASKQRIIQKSTSKRLRKQEGYVVIDVETTGLESETDEIIELAAIRVLNHKVVDTYSSFVKPACSIPKNIIELTGITQEMVEKDGKSLHEAVLAFLDFLGDSVIVSHNVRFDRAFLDAACIKLGIEKIKNKGKDTLGMSRRRVEDVPNYRLKTLAEHFNIKTDETHRALADCLITFQLYEKLNEL